MHIPATHGHMHDGIVEHSRSSREQDKRQEDERREQGVEEKHRDDGIVRCDKEPTEAPVNKPTIGIMEPEFDAKSMVVKVMIAPSTDATAWYWRVDGGDDTLDEAFTKIEGAAAKQVEFTATYHV